MVGPKGSVADQFNWGRADTGCSNLVCTKCGDQVVWEKKTFIRHYKCSCTEWECRHLEAVTAYYIEGPADIEVEMPPWRCAGHPQTESPGPLSKKERAALLVEDSEAVHRWDRAYHTWAHTERASEILTLLEQSAVVTQLLFFELNPNLPGATRVADLAARMEDPGQAEMVSLTLAAVYKATSDQRVLEQMQRQALRPGWSADIIPYLEKPWLLEHAEEIVKAAPQAAARLCARAGRGSYGWDTKALAQLPLEVLRAGAAVMPRGRLYADELDVYWERDYEWLAAHMPELCSEASDFYFYFQEFLDRRGWQPNERIIQVWRAQAVDIEHAYNALPPLIRYDREWVVAHLGEIIDKSQTRGVWIVDKLKRVGVDIEPLIPVLRERDPKDLESHLPLWFPERSSK